LALYFQVLALFGVFSMIALLTNRMVEAILKKELGTEDDTEAFDMSDEFEADE
jgi:hypothetical protein